MSINITVQKMGAFIEECEELVFSASAATNDLGEGEQGSITGGLPKANGLLITCYYYCQEHFLCAIGLTSYNSTVHVFVLFNAELEPRAESVSR